MKRAIEELNRSRFQPLTCHDPLRDGFVHIALIVDAQEFRRPPSAEPQQFAGYAVKVRLTEEVAEGDLVLASVPSGELRLLKATESMEFTEVVSEEPVSRVKVLGVVVEEQHFMTQEQRDNFPSSA